MEGPWNGNTSPTVTAADSALTGTTSLKQRLFFLRSNAHCYIPDYPASGLYLLAAFGMPFFSPQFFFISLLTFYLQTFVGDSCLYNHMQVAQYSFAGMGLGGSEVFLSEEMWLVGLFFFLMALLFRLLTEPMPGP